MASATTPPARCTRGTAGKCTSSRQTRRPWAARRHARVRHGGWRHCARPTDWTPPPRSVDSSVSHPIQLRRRAAHSLGAGGSARPWRDIAGTWTAPSGPRLTSDAVNIAGVHEALRPVRLRARVTSSTATEHAGAGPRARDGAEPEHALAAHHILMPDGWKGWKGTAADCR